MVLQRDKLDHALLDRLALQLDLAEDLLPLAVLAATSERDQDERTEKNVETMRRSAHEGPLIEDERVKGAETSFLTEPGYVGTNSYGVRAQARSWLIYLCETERVLASFPRRRHRLAERR